MSGTRAVAPVGPRIAVVLGCVLVALAACGGAPGPGPTGSSGGVGWRYVAFGDSVTTGVGSDVSYADLYAVDARSAVGVPVALDNLAVNGSTSADLLDDLNSDPDVQAALAGAKLVTVEIGGNDYDDAHTAFANGVCGGADGLECMRQAVASFEANFAQIMAIAVEVRDPKTTIIRTIDIYDTSDDIVQDTASGNLVVMLSYLEEMNAFIATTAARYGIPNALNFLAFNGPDGTRDPATEGLMAQDGVHPSAEGQQVIAGLLRDLGYAPLA